jgi:hypothetical protein
MLQIGLCVLALVRFVPVLSVERPIRLVGAFEGTVSGGGWIYPGGPVITGEYFRLTYDPLEPGESFPDSTCVGCSTVVPLGWVGSIRFDPSTEGARFQAFAERLTNGTNEPLDFGVYVKDEDRVYPGVGNSYPESRLFRRLAKSNAAWDIQYIVVQILSNDVETSFEKGYHVTATMKWEVWGTRR